jgi:SnoaL-like protein
VEPELERVVAESEIRRVLSRYSRAIDRRDYELLRRCYHPGAIDEHGWYDGDVDGFVKFLQDGSPARFESHFLGNPDVEVDGDVAWTETYCLALRRVESDGREPRDRMQHVRYCDRFEKRDGEWRIAHRVVSYGHGRFDRVDEPTEFWDSHVRDRRDRSDAVYRLREQRD